MSESAHDAALLGGFSPFELADLMLLETLARGEGSLVLEPRDAERYQFRYEDSDHGECLAVVPAEIAQAAQIRLAVIAGQAFVPPLLAKLPIRTTSRAGGTTSGKRTVFLTVRASSLGPVCELVALDRAHRHEGEGGVAGIAGVPFAGAAAKYQVVSELGRGGMGIVYLARHVALDKQVAIKVLSPGMAQRRDVAAQFVVEGRAACRAQHRAVIDVTDFGRLSDGRDYLVMEYVGWPTLAAELRRGALALGRALALAKELASGMLAAHERGVVHRDLKPANVFVGTEGEVKIVDFGLAYSGDEDGMQGGCFGTPHYMSPEQAMGQHVDRRADIYAFGCMLFEMISGRKPFDGGSPREILEAHRSEAVPALPGVSPRLATLCSSLMAKSPDQRPESFAVVVDEIGALQREGLG